MYNDKEALDEIIKNIQIYTKQIVTDMKGEIGNTKHETTVKL